MGELDGRTYLVTGANTGIGLETARGLARRGAKVQLACRSAERGRAAIADIAASEGGETERRLGLLELDLGNLESVRSCAARVHDSGEPLHGLINNAGLAGQRGMTASGFEMAFGTNHVGPFLLTSLLLDRLRASAPARVVIVASGAHRSAKGIDWDAVRRPTASRGGLHEYAVSKLANVLHAKELAVRLEGTGVSAYSLHPGVIASDIWRQVPWPIRPLMKLRMRSTEAGARTTLYCATAPELDHESGRYYDDCRRAEPSAVATPELAEELWARSEAWVG